MCLHADRQASVLMLLWCLPSQFRLLQVCESRQHNGSLEGIDALLGILFIWCHYTLYARIRGTNMRCCNLLFMDIVGKALPPLPSTDCIRPVLFICLKFKREDYQNWQPCDSCVQWRKQMWAVLTVKYLFCFYFCVIVLTQVSLYVYFSC